MASQTLTLMLEDERATRALAARLAPLLRAGDAVLLEGQIGAGKSFLSRAIIQNRARAEIEVPSPTYTLVQTYDLESGALWHADLYRLSDPDETVELGLIEAFETSICLVEWPDRLGPYMPRGALHVLLEAEGEARRITLTGSARWGTLITELANA